MQISNRRLIDRALRYWQDVGGERDCPSLRQMVERKDSDIWPNAFIIQADKARDEYIFRYCGPSLVVQAGRDPTGQSVRDLPREVADDALDLCVAALWARKPVANSNYLFGSPGKEIRYRLILLPLNDDGEDEDENVGTLFGAVSHKIVDLAESAG